MSGFGSRPSKKGSSGSSGGFGGSSWGFSGPSGGSRPSKKGSSGSSGDFSGSREGFGGSSWGFSGPSGGSRPSKKGSSGSSGGLRRSAESKGIESKTLEKGASPPSQEERGCGGLEIDGNAGSQEKESETTSVTSAQRCAPQQETSSIKEVSTGTEVTILNCLRATGTISNSGGSIVIPDTGVELHIPPEAFDSKTEKHQIDMRIIPTFHTEEISHSFEDNTTIMVEILPNMLQLRQTAKLILPHCLVLSKTDECQVKIFQSHHHEGQQPLWEDISETAHPRLRERFCEFELRKFCWIKYTIRGESVLGKKLFLYTIGENHTERHVTATVGYIPGLAGDQEVIREEFNEAAKGTVYKSNLPGRIMGFWQSFIFRKEPTSPLKISIDEFVPEDGWQPGEKRIKIISYSDVELSNEQSRSFTFTRMRANVPFPVCHFKISQVEETEIHINLALPPSDQSPALPRHLPIFDELSSNEILNLASCLDQVDPLRRDWRMLAGRLGFKYNDVRDFERKQSPTEAVIVCAAQSGSLSTKAQLIQILENMDRVDATNAISG